MHAIRLLLIGLSVIVCHSLPAGDNELTDEERAAGWQLIFDGATTNNWLDSKQQPVPATHVQADSLNPHPCNYMLIYKEPVDDFELALDFKISPRCNSGVFIRTFPLTPRPGKDVGFNGIEIAIDDTTTAGYHDTGAIYDLVQPVKNTMKKAGEWNHLHVSCDKNLIRINVNGAEVTSMDLDQWTTAHKRPDGSDHKFDVAYKDHPRHGYIGLQDHGGDVWYKNIKLKKLNKQK